MPTSARLALPLLALAGCVSGPLDLPSRCDPRAMEAGEVRARELYCTDELVSGGEGRVGDYLLENSVGRFVVRGAYAPLTVLEGDGGTLIDAAAPGSIDLVSELIPDVDRSSVTPVSGDGWAELREPGLTWHLDADRGALELRAPATDPDAPAEPLDGGFDALFRPITGAYRTGSTALYGDVWLGVDGTVGEGVGAVNVSGVTQVSLAPDEAWPDGDLIDTPTAAGDLRVDLDGETITRLPVISGLVHAHVPTGATVAPEGGACLWLGLGSPWCGYMNLQVRDQDRHLVTTTIWDGDGSWVLRPYDTHIGVGPIPRTFQVWAGPAYSIGSIWYDGTDTPITLTLTREMDTANAVLADLDRAAAPDDSTATAGWDALHTSLGLGYQFAALVADDEIPLIDRYAHDEILGVVASRAGNLVWSWPWTATTKRAAHGALPWQGLSMQDLLTVARGGATLDRLTIVRPAWVEGARAEAAPSAWPVAPDALWLQSLDDLPTYLDLLNDWVDVAPVGPRTWVEVGAAVNEPAVEKGILEARTTAGNGPRLRLAVAPTSFPSLLAVTVTVDASRWMGVQTVTLTTPDRTVAQPLDHAGTATFVVGADQRWAVATVEGARTEAPWMSSPAWAVSGPLWILGPDGAPAEDGTFGR